MRLISQIFVSLAACFLLVPEAQAAVILNVDGSGQLIGAQNVDVGGTLYDVEFVDGTCIALFDACDDLSDFTFTTAAAAHLASTALLDQVFIGAFDDFPILILPLSEAAPALTM